MNILFNTILAASTGGYGVCCRIPILRDNAFIYEITSQRFESSEPRHISSVFDCMEL